MRADGVLAHVMHSGLEDPTAALGAFAHGFLAGEINLRRFSIRVGLLLAEIELGFQFRGELNDRCERFAHFAAKTLQRSHLAFGDELLDFRNFQLAAGNDFPQAKVAFLALKFLVVFVNLPAALRAGNLKGAEIARHRIALMALGLRHDVPGHVGDLFHELRALHLPARHLAQFEFPVPRQFGRR